MTSVESPTVLPVPSIGHGPATVLEMGLQNRQPAFQLLTRIEAGAGSGEFVLEELAFETQGAFDEVAQTPGLVAKQAAHFGDEVEDNAGFFGQDPAELMGAGREVAGVGKGGDTAGDLVFHEAAETQNRQVATAQEVERAGLPLRLPITVDDPAVDADEGRVDDGGTLGATGALLD